MSITMGTTLASLVTNKRRVSALKSLGIVTVGDALTYYPFRVTEPVPLRAIREAAPGQQMAFAAVIRDMRVVPMNARRGYRLEATVDDADFARSRRVPGSTARLTFFSYRKSYVDGSACDCAPARLWWSPVCPANTWVSCSSPIPKSSLSRPCRPEQERGLRVTLGARHPAMVRLREVPIRMPVRSPRIRRPRLPLPGPR